MKKITFRGNNTNSLDVVFLAAGNGSRLNEFTENIPKPLIPINGIPIIDYILKNLLFLDIQRIIFVVGYKRDVLISYLNDNYSKDVELHFALNNQIERENGYSLFCAREFIKQDRFLLLMADHVVDTEIYAQISDNEIKGDIILATDSLSNLNDPADATKVLLDGNRIVKIGKNIREYDAYDTGVFTMSKSIFPVLERLCKDRHKVGISDLVNRCIKINMQVHSCDITGCFWKDIDTREDIELLLQQMPQDEENTGNDEII